MHISVCTIYTVFINYSYFAQPKLTTDADNVHVFKQCYQTLCTDSKHFILYCSTSKDSYMLGKFSKAVSITMTRLIHLQQMLVNFSLHHSHTVITHAPTTPHQWKLPGPCSQHKAAIHHQKTVISHFGTNFATVGLEVRGRKCGVEFQPRSEPRPHASMQAGWKASGIIVPVQQEGNRHTFSYVISY